MSRVGVGVLSLLVGFGLAACNALGSLASVATTTWWQGSGPSACGPPAVYRVNLGPMQAVDDCAGILLIPPHRVIVAVGAEVDVHITEESSGPTGNQLVPTYPTPTSNNPSVLSTRSMSDGGSTVSFMAVGPGSADVMTRALCSSSGTEPNVVERCPIIEVSVP